MSADRQTPEQPPISVHKLPPSVLRRVDIILIVWMTFTLILVSVLFVAFFPSDLFGDSPLGRWIPWIAVALAVLAATGFYGVYRLAVRTAFLREARCELHVDRLLWIAPPMAPKTILREDVTRVEELPAGGGLLLTLGSGRRTFTIPPDVERFDELKVVLSNWA